MESAKPRFRPFVRDTRFSRFLSIPGRNDFLMKIWSIPSRDVSISLITLPTELNVLSFFGMARWSSTLGVGAAKAYPQITNNAIV